MPIVSMKTMPNTGGGHGLTSVDDAGEKSPIEVIKGMVNHFAARHGRRPRVLVSHIGPGGQRRALNQVAALFARRGFDVDIAPVGQLPHQTAMMAIENDVHMVCLLCAPDRQSRMETEVIDVLTDHDRREVLVAFFGETHPAGNHRQTSAGRSGPVAIRAAAADADIIAILGKLTRQNLL